MLAWRTAALNPEADASVEVMGAFDPLALASDDFAMVATGALGSFATTGSLALAALASGELEPASVELAAAAAAAAGIALAETCCGFTAGIPSSVAFRDDIDG